jgi:hypothetical protein
LPAATATLRLSGTLLEVESASGMIAQFDGIAPVAAGSMAAGRRSRTARSTEGALHGQRLIARKR